jgi:hypothetical protein
MIASRSVGLLPRKRLITPAQRHRNVTPTSKILSNLRKLIAFFKECVNKNLTLLSNTHIFPPLPMDVE